MYRSGAHLAISLDPDGVGELLLRALPLPCADDDDDNADDDNGGDIYVMVYSHNWLLCIITGFYT